MVRGVDRLEAAPPLIRRCGLCASHPAPFDTPDMSA
jgi:hypothetical protein